MPTVTAIQPHNGAGAGPPTAAAVVANPAQAAAAAIAAQAAIQQAAAAQSVAAAQQAAVAAAGNPIVTSPGTISQSHVIAGGIVTVPSAHGGGPNNQKDTTWTKLFVGGLPYHTTDKSLREHFEVYGDIDEAVVITDRQTGKSRGYGFVSISFCYYATKFICIQYRNFH